MPLDFSGNLYNKASKRSLQDSTEQGMNGAKVNSIEWPTTKPKYSLRDLILDEPVKNSLLDAIAFYDLKDRLMYEWGLSERYQDRLNLSINLYGDSGTGKTMAAHAIAHELNKEIIFVDYAEIESKYVGETSKNIKQLFISAKNQEAIIIFDEADALLSRRVTDMRSSTDVSVNQTRSVLLNILNDYQGVVIFTTNFIQNFDPAFMRRIKYQIRFDLPNEKLRSMLWKMYIPDKMPTNVDTDKLAIKFDGISGSDIANAVFAAAISAARLKKGSVSQSDFETAIESIISAKSENSQQNNITKRVVSEEYVKRQLGVERI